MFQLDLVSYVLRNPAAARVGHPGVASGTEVWLIMVEHGWYLLSYIHREHALLTAQALYAHLREVEQNPNHMLARWLEFNTVADPENTLHCWSADTGVPVMSSDRETESRRRDRLALFAARLAGRLLDDLVNRSAEHEAAESIDAIRNRWNEIIIRAILEEEKGGGR
jgi:hypothetical protein